MTERTIDDDGSTTTGVTDRDEFERRLRRLIRTAESNGVEVRGGWEVEGVSGRGWDVEIVETRKPADTSRQRSDPTTGPP